jgi:DNA polymerase III delta prime subunit
MSVWLDQHKPVLFDDLLTSSSVIDALKHLSLQANPPHLLLSGPAGCGKTTALQLVCRQVLGPSWRATTHVLQARDLDKTAGAMAKFEAFLRPEGAGSEDTLAGRTSLDAFDHNISASADASPPPAGEESIAPAAGTLAAVSRIIIIEDADYLGHARQSYLRRMMEESSRSARFLFTTHTPSRIIEALRSRTQHVRMPSLTRLMIEQRLETISREEGLNPTPGVLGDIAHVANGNLRKSIFTLQLMAQRNLLSERKNIQLLMANSSRREVQLVLEEALRGRVHDWKWERQGEKNTRVLKGAMGALDQMMSAHDLDGRGVVDRLHHFLVAGRTHYPDDLLAALLNAVSSCDTRLQRSAQQRIQLEELMHQISAIGDRFLRHPASQSS